MARLSGLRESAWLRRTHRGSPQSSHDAAMRLTGGVVEAKAAEVGRQIDGLQPESGRLAVQLACQRRRDASPCAGGQIGDRGGGILVRRHQHAVVVLGRVVG